MLIIIQRLGSKTPVALPLAYAAEVNTWRITNKVTDAPTCQQSCI